MLTFNDRRLALLTTGLLVSSLLAGCRAAGYRAAVDTPADAGYAQVHEDQLAEAAGEPPFWRGPSNPLPAPVSHSESDRSTPPEFPEDDSLEQDAQPATDGPTFPATDRYLPRTNVSSIRSDSAATVGGDRSGEAGEEGFARRVTLPVTRRQPRDNTAAAERARRSRIGAQLPTVEQEPVRLDNPPALLAPPTGY